MSSDPSPEALSAARRVYIEHKSFLLIARIIDEAFDPLRRENRELREALKELADLVEASIECETKLDSFTTQPARTALQAALNPKVTP